MRIVSEEFSEGWVREMLFRILEVNVLCSIATVTAEQRAHINTAYFAYTEDLELYFLSDPGSFHCRNLLTNSSMAMTIFSSSQEWGAGHDQGVQLFGNGHQAKGLEATKAEQSYGDRFPAYSAWKAGLEKDDPVRAYRFYSFLVEKIKILDEATLGDALFASAAVNRGHRSS